MALVNLYSIPEYNMSYEHAPFFSSKSSQNNWFATKRKTRLECKVSVDANRTSITIPLSFEEVENMDIDYCTLVKNDGRLYFYFVVDYDYTTTAATTLILALDPLQTYMFDFKFKDSYVDRCHVNRWTSDGMPTKELEPEGLDFGENIPCEEPILIKKNDSDNILIVASNPLGKVNRKNRSDGWNPDGKGGGSDTDCGDWLNGTITVDGFRFIKGHEGFGAYPYKDSAGYWTVGYGITQRWWPDYYNRLANNPPCTEEEASKIMLDMVTEHFAKAIVSRCKELGITKQNQFDALVSLAFNAGNSAVLGDNELTRLIKANPLDENTIRPVWTTYKVSAGSGLVRRRTEECDVFFKGSYSKNPIITIKENGKYGPYVEENNGNGWLPVCDQNSENGEVPDIGNMKAFKAYGINFIYPMQGGRSHISSKLGWRKHPIQGTMKFHNGDDIACSLNEPIYATHSGKVVKSTFQGSNDPNNKHGFGNWIIIQNDDLKIQTYYAHCNKRLVEEGAYVKQGQKIALAGTTGGSTGVHLHYELRIGSPYGSDKVKDPLPHMKNEDIM